MRPWQFRQKTPGFGISKDFYLTVLAATAQLPSIVEVVDPHALNGAVEGFGVPLSREATKDFLAKPMERGIYGLASKNRQTVLRLVVIPKEEAGFDPGPFLRSAEGAKLSPEHLARISATWTLLQLTFETHEAMVYASLDFLLQVVRRLAFLTEGVVSDPISRVYLLPGEVMHQQAGSVGTKQDPPIDARDFVKVWYNEAQKGWAYTLGLQKFAMPEFEMFGVLPSEEREAEAFLYGLAQAALAGKAPTLGSYVGSRSCPLQVAEGGLNRANWEGIQCYELIPPSGKKVGESLEAWSEAPKR